MNNIKNTWKKIKSVYLPMNPTSQTKQKFQMSLINILQQLSKKQKKIWIPRTNISLISEKTDIKTPFFLSPNNKSEIQNMIFSFDSNKSVGPNTIPIKILKLLKNDISYLTY